MDAKQLFAAGKLSAAIDLVTTEVRSHPTDLQRRTFLFELLCFAGELDRAHKQLDAVGHQDAMAEPAAQAYHNVLEAESARRRLYADGTPPEFLLEPPSYARFHLEAVARLGGNRPAEANVLLEESESLRPALAGTIDGRAFADFRDCDDLLAPFLELFVLRDYVWLPFEQIREIEFSAPERPRDLLWAAARIVLVDDSQRRGYVPVLYCGSHQHPDDNVKLGRLTDWRTPDSGPTLGIGQRLFLAGEEGQPVLETRRIEFQPPAA